MPALSPSGDLNLAEQDPRPLPEGVRDLGDSVYLLDKTLQIAVAREFDIVGDRLRHYRVTRKVSAHHDAHRVEVHTEAGCLAKEIVGNATCDREVEQLATVEALSAASSISRSIDHDGEGAGRANRRDLTCDSACLDGEHTPECIPLLFVRLRERPVYLGGEHGPGIETLGWASVLSPNQPFCPNARVRVQSRGGEANTGVRTIPANWAFPTLAWSHECHIIRVAWPADYPV